MGRLIRVCSIYMTRGLLDADLCVGLPTPTTGDGGAGNDGEAGLMEDCIMDYWQDYPNPSYIWDDDFSTSLADFIT